MSSIMPELSAMQIIAGAICSLTPSERRRVTTWLTAYVEDDDKALNMTSNDDVAQVGKAKVTDIVTDDDVVEEAEHEAPASESTSFSALYCAVAPKTGAQKAVTAAYWLETHEGKPSWKASEINKLLKSIDVTVSSVSIVLTNAVKAKNALITELGRLGDSERSRKMFCLSDAGVAFVEGSQC